MDDAFSGVKNIDLRNSKNSDDESKDNFDNEIEDTNRAKHKDYVKAMSLHVKLLNEIRKEVRQRFQLLYSIDEVISSNRHLTQRVKKDKDSEKIQSVATERMEMAKGSTSLSKELREIQVGFKSKYASEANQSRLEGAPIEEPAERFHINSGATTSQLARSDQQLDEKNTLFLSRATQKTLPHGDNSWLDEGLHAKPSIHVLSKNMSPPSVSVGLERRQEQNVEKADSSVCRSTKGETTLHGTLPHEVKSKIQVEVASSKIVQGASVGNTDTSSGQKAADNSKGFALHDNGVISLLSRQPRLPDKTFFLESEAKRRRSDTPANIEREARSKEAASFLPHYARTNDKVKSRSELCGPSINDQSSETNIHLAFQGSHPQHQTTVQSTSLLTISTGLPSSVDCSSLLIAKPEDVYSPLDYSLPLSQHKIDFAATPAPRKLSFDFKRKKDLNDQSSKASNTSSTVLGHACFPLHRNSHTQSRNSATKIIQLLREKSYAANDPSTECHVEGQSGQNDLTNYLANKTQGHQQQQQNVNPENEFHERDWSLNKQHSQSTPYTSAAKSPPLEDKNSPHKAPNVTSYTMSSSFESQDSRNSCILTNTAQHETRDQWESTEARLGLRLKRALRQKSAGSFSGTHSQTVVHNGMNSSKAISYPYDTPTSSNHSMSNSKIESRNSKRPAQGHCLQLKSFHPDQNYHPCPLMSNTLHGISPTSTQISNGPYSVPATASFAASALNGFLPISAPLPPSQLYYP